jgi:cytochrome b6-f complex iron-sulfur subunit
MKLKESLLSRRQLFTGFICGGLGALAAFALYPVAGFLFHKKKMPLPKAVTVAMADVAKLTPNSAVYFKYGRLPGVLLKTGTGELRAFSAKCTHLDCNVTYVPAERKFFCACHNGYFDDTGLNVAGPPPRPLDLFDIKQEGEQLVLSFKEETTEKA